MSDTSDKPTVSSGRERYERKRGKTAQPDAGAPQTPASTGVSRGRERYRDRKQHRANNT